MTRARFTCALQSKLPATASRVEGVRLDRSEPRCQGREGAVTVSVGGRRTARRVPRLLCENMRGLGSHVFGKKTLHRHSFDLPRRRRGDLSGARRREAGRGRALLHGWGNHRGADRVVAEAVQPEQRENAEYHPTCCRRAVERGQRVFRIRPLDDRAAPSSSSGSGEPPPAPRGVHVAVCVPSGGRLATCDGQPAYDRVIRTVVEAPARRADRSRLGPLIVRGSP